MHPTLHLLGKPTVTLGDERLEPPPGKISALLLYLACADGWVPRDDLLYLLWPDTPEKKARNNLRQLLHRVGDVDWADALEREPTRLRWNVSTDIRRFRDALETGASDAAVEHYRGPLLDGFRIGDAPEFASWLELEREALHGAWRNAALARADALRGTGDAAAAAALLGSLLATDPLDEAALRARLETLGTARRRTEALAEYEAYRERLAAELGVEPEPETDALADAIRRGDTCSGAAESTAATPSRRPLPPLPTPPTPFVGRREELHRLAATLSERRPRLLTLVAPGGMGKTRLALALARQRAPEHGAGAVFASFAAVTHPSQMDAALAEALDLPLTNELPPRDQLVVHLAGRDALLVLDNLEHLTGDLSLVETLLERCPDLTLIATSRERLGLRAETVYDVAGMGLTPAPGENVSDAAALFIRSAERVRGAPSDAEPEPDAVVRICRAVRGMPLALSLAAGWLRVLSAGEIADELETGLELLAGGPGDAPERHRSVRAVFDATWQRLGPAEREGWARLSVFEAPFDREAARAVAGVGLPLLLALVDKALLARRDDGRFELHPLLRRYGRERLAALGLEGAARERHAAHHLDEITHLVPAFAGNEQLAALARAAERMPDIRAAWRHAAERRDAARLADGMLALFDYDEFRPLEGFGPLCDLAVDALGGAAALENGPPPVQLAIARLLPGTNAPPTTLSERLRRSIATAERLNDTAGLARLHLVAARNASLDHLVTGHEHHAEAARTRYRKLGDEHGVTRIDREIGWRHLAAGAYQDALTYLEPAAARFRLLGDAIHEASTLDPVVWAHAFRRDLERADETTERIEVLHRTLGMPSLEADFAGTRRFLEMIRGDLDAAEHHQEHYIAFHEALGADGGVSAMLRSEIHLRRGAYAGARREALLAREIFRRRGHRGTLLAETEQHLARVELRDGGRLERAREHLRAALELALHTDTPRVLNDIAVAAAELLKLEGRDALAAEMVAAVRDDPATEVRTWQEIGRLLDAGLEIPTNTVVRDRNWTRTTLQGIYGPG